MKKRALKGEVEKTESRTREKTFQKKKKSLNLVLMKPEKNEKLGNSDQPFVDGASAPEGVEKIGERLLIGSKLEKKKER